MTNGPVSDDDDYVPADLVKLGMFDWPRSETRQTLGHLFEKIKGGFIISADPETVDEQDLKRVSEDALKMRVSELLTDSLGKLLDDAYLDWAKNTDGAPMRRVFVYPPTSDHMLADWATLHKLIILKPDDAVDDLPSDACIVIPKLEAFFSRDYNKLADLFGLLGKLSDRNGKALVGCNSWAWKFLKQFDDAHLLFEDQKTFPAYDANALAEVMQSALSSRGTQRSIRSIKSGGSIFERDSDGELDDAYFETLAGRSLGHPWVAIEMFFHGIAEVDGDKASPDATWVDIPKPCSLPARGSEALVFALQTLMIHGPGRIEDLNALLPRRVPNGTWIELERAGFIEIDDGIVCCITRNYPDIRSELSAAGFNLDEL